jgi:hypothetical protein
MGHSLFFDRYFCVERNDQVVFLPFDKEELPVANRCLRDYPIPIRAIGLCLRLRYLSPYGRRRHPQLPLHPVCGLPPSSQKVDPGGGCLGTVATGTLADKAVR